MRRHLNPIFCHRRQKQIWGALILSAITVLFLPVNAPAAETGTKASIYAYFRIAGDEHPSVSIRMNRLRQHINQLEKDNIHAISLDTLIKSLKDRRPVPANSIAITFEGAHRSVMQKAVPLLKDRDIPFGIFIAPGRIDMSMPQYMSWKELRALHQHELATIGVSLNRYRHGVTLPSQKRKAGLNRAIARYREEFGHRPDYFAYPYGEYDNIFQETVRKYGFRAAFGQQSGVAHTQSDFYGLPRFTMTDNYGDVRRFRQTARALPLPIRDVIPASPVVAENPPKIGFSLSSELNIPAKDLKCYASNGAPVTKKIIAETRVELRIKEPFAARRGRVNCIVPENGQDRDTGKQRWRWHGMMFVIPDDLRAGGGEKD